MRVYSHIQKNVVRKVNRSHQLVFKIDAEKVENFEEWVVVGIKFHQYEQGKANQVLFTIYIYHFREKFKIIDVICKIYAEREEIILEFSPSDRNQEIPEFQDNNAGDKFLINIVTILRNSFHEQKYKRNEKGIFDVIENLGCDDEKKHLSKEKSLVECSNCLVYTVAVGVTCIGLVLYFKYSRQK